MSTIPKKMSAVLTTGHGGYEVLKFSDDVEVPQPSSDQVLIKVLGAGINNTDINTRTAWYSKSVIGETNAEDSQGKDDDGSWSGEPLKFPIIQGAGVMSFLRYPLAGSSMRTVLMGFYSLGW